MPYMKLKNKTYTIITSVLFLYCVGLSLAFDPYIGLKDNSDLVYNQFFTFYLDSITSLVKPFILNVLAGYIFYKVIEYYDY